LPTAWTGFSVKWYGALLENDDILRAAGNTLIVALFSTFLSTVLGTLLAVGVEIRRRTGKWLETVIFAPMIIPDIVLAIALLSFFSLLGVRMGLHTIIAAHVVFNLAFVCAVVRARLKSFDWSIVEASADLGASTATTLMRVVVPVLMPAIIAGALLAFTLSVDEFIIAFFTAGAGRSSITLPMQIFAMIRFGVTPEINALATIVMSVSVVALALSQRLNKGGLPGQ
jgi:spermidine/putrescine transport system permease protein